MGNGSRSMDAPSPPSPGRALRDRLGRGGALPLVGVYDVFSARLAGARFEGVFLSGFSFAASAFGLPDIGYVTWRDMVDFTGRVRRVLPHSHLLVDVDDGFGDAAVAATSVAAVEAAGASAVMIEDQRRPRRCGHAGGKQLLALDEQAQKLEEVLAARRDTVVVARTDASHPGEVFERLACYQEVGADALMAEAVTDLAIVRDLARRLRRPLLVNQLHGGRSPNWSLAELADAGASMVVYSTPCLFAAQHAVERYLDAMAGSGALPADGTADLAACSRVLGGRVSFRGPGAAR